MKLVEVTDRKTEKQFLDVPHYIYKNDKNWIPHLEKDIRKVFSSENKAYRAENCIRYILMNEEKTIGRISAFINPTTYNSEQFKTGGVGFFECIDNQKAANLLLDSSMEWLESRGIQAVDGPINLGERDQFWGCLIENFDSMGSYGINYNPPYYSKLLETYGFKNYFEQYCFKRDMLQKPSPIFQRAYDKILENTDYRVSDVQGMSIEKIAKDFVTVYNGAWKGSYRDFKEMKYETALELVGAMKSVMDKKIVYFAYYKDQPVSFAVSLPELNEVFQYVNGKLNIWGKIKFLFHKTFNPPKTMVGIVFGVVKEFQRKGIEGMMFAWGHYNIIPQGQYNALTQNWIGDFNPKMLKITERLGSKKYRMLVTYRYMIDKEIPFERHPVVNIN